VAILRCVQFQHIDEELVFLPDINSTIPFNKFTHSTFFKYAIKKLTNMRRIIKFDHANLPLEDKKKDVNDNTNYELDEEYAPNEFYCPISKEIMRDPVIARDGQSYEREKIIAWFLRKNISPVTGQILDSTDVISNINLKKLIAEFMQKQKQRNTSVESNRKDNPTSTSSTANNKSITTNRKNSNALESALNKLKEMGFSDEVENNNVLSICNNDIDKAIELMMQKY